MRKLILILLAFIALFTFIRAFNAEAVEGIPAGTSAEVSGASAQIPMEIVR